MATLSEICFSIINTIRPLSVNTDSINKELVAFHVHNIRAQLAKQQIVKYGSLDTSFIQTLGCVNLVLADRSECCEFTTDCLVLKTDVKIPKTINNSLLTRVGPVNLLEPKFDHIEYLRVPFWGLNKYTRNNKAWFRPNHNSYLYLISDDANLLNTGLEVINIMGILENPEDASSFHDCSTGEACFNYDSQYPIPSSMIGILQDMVIKQFLSIQYKAPIDSSNNNSVDLSIPIK